MVFRGSIDVQEHTSAQCRLDSPEHGPQQVEHEHAQLNDREAVDASSSSALPAEAARTMTGSAGREQVSNWQVDCLVLISSLWYQGWHTRSQQAIKHISAASATDWRRLNMQQRQFSCKGWVVLLYT